MCEENDFIHLPSKFSKLSATLGSISKNSERYTDKKAYRIEKKLEAILEFLNADMKEERVVRERNAWYLNGMKVMSGDGGEEIVDKFTVVPIKKSKKK